MGTGSDIFLKIPQGVVLCNFYARYSYGDGNFPLACSKMMFPNFPYMFIIAIIKKVRKRKGTVQRVTFAV